MLIVASSTGSQWNILKGFNIFCFHLAKSHLWDTNFCCHVPTKTQRAHARINVTNCHAQHEIDIEMNDEYRIEIIMIQWLLMIIQHDLHIHNQLWHHFWLSDRCRHLGHLSESQAGASQRWQPDIYGSARCHVWRRSPVSTESTRDGHEMDTCIPVISLNGTLIESLQRDLHQYLRSILDLEWTFELHLTLPWLWYLLCLMLVSACESWKEKAAERLWRKASQNVFTFSESNLKDRFDMSAMKQKTTRDVDIKSGQTFPGFLLQKKSLCPQNDMIYAGKLTCLCFCLPWRTSNCSVESKSLLRPFVVHFEVSTQSFSFQRYHVLSQFLCWVKCLESVALQNVSWNLRSRSARSGRASPLEMHKE